MSQSSAAATPEWPPRSRSSAAIHRSASPCCVDRLEEFIDEAGLECDKIRPGFLRVATAPSYVNRLRKQVELMTSLGFDRINWIDAAATRRMVDSELGDTSIATFIGSGRTLRKSRSSIAGAVRSRSRRISLQPSGTSATITTPSTRWVASGTVSR